MPHITNETQALKSAFEAVKNYNSQFSGGMGIMAAIFDYAFKEDHFNPSSVDTDEKDSLAFKTGQNVNFREFLDNHQITLERLGLGVRNVKGHATIFGGLEGALEEKKIELSIEDPERFKRTLSEISDIDVDQDSALKESLRALCAGSCRIIYEEGVRRINRNSSDIAAPLMTDEQISAHLPLMGELSRLGFTDDIKLLHELLSAHQKGFLPELALVESYGLLLDKNSGKFGPGEWIIDMKPELFRSRWDAASNGIPNLLYLNPASHLLLKEVIDNLSDCIHASRQRIAESDSKYIQTNSDSYLQTLEAADQNLRLYSLM